VNRVLFALLASFAVASAFARTADAPEVIFVSPCECQGFHGKNRWVTKTDLTPVPSDKSAIQSVTPSQIYVWEGLAPDVDLTGYTEARLPSEQKWYALTGRVVDAKVEADGDIHIALVDATGENVGTVSAEIPVGPKWCEIRQTVFSWTAQKFPFGIKTFTAFIPSASAGQFSQPQQYEGRTVAMSGKITSYKGKPEMLIRLRRLAHSDDDQTLCIVHSFAGRAIRAGLGRLHIRL